MNKSEMKEVVAEVMKELKAESLVGANTPTNGAGEVAKNAGENNGAAETITRGVLEQMIQAEINKALHPEEEVITPENMQEFIAKAVKEAMEPILKSTGVPTNLNDAGVQKGAEEQHYLHGII